MNCIHFLTNNYAASLLLHKHNSFVISISWLGKRKIRYQDASVHRSMVFCDNIQYVYVRASYLALLSIFFIFRTLFRLHAFIVILIIEFGCETNNMLFLFSLANEQNSVLKAYVTQLTRHQLSHDCVNKTVVWNVGDNVQRNGGNLKMLHSLNIFV